MGVIYSGQVPGVDTTYHKRCTPRPRTQLALGKVQSDVNDDLDASTVDYEVKVTSGNCN
jgi:hypothetical protein